MYVCILGHYLNIFCAKMLHTITMASHYGGTMTIH